MRGKSITIWDIQKILLRKGRLIAVCTVFGGLLLWGISTLLLPEMYTTSASLYVYSISERQQEDNLDIT